MASFQPSWLSSLKTINTISSTNPTLFPSTTHKNSLFKFSFSLNPSNAESSRPISRNSSESTPEPEPGPIDPVKLAFEKAKGYKKSIQSNPNSKIEQNPVEDSGGVSDGNNRNKGVPVSVKAAMENAKEVKKNKGIVGGVRNGDDSSINSGLKAEGGGDLQNEIVEKRVSKKEALKISNIDFVGLEFADKKTGRGLPAGLVPVTDPFPDGDLPEVEIIVGDTRRFGEALKPEPTLQDNSDLYKPKVSTWGVFPRPGNISKTFGGGKVIRPGDVLETEEDRAAKEEHTRQLLAAYKKKIGLNIDAELKSECEKALKDGDSLMNSGKLKEALPCYEKVMDKLAFKSELHGLAALQWSICQDSLSRSNEARIMYEKLQSHPNANVRKKAKQFMFSFQAMEMIRLQAQLSHPKTQATRTILRHLLKIKPNTHNKRLKLKKVH